VTQIAEPLLNGAAHQPVNHHLVQTTRQPEVISIIAIPDSDVCDPCDIAITSRSTSTPNSEASLIPAQSFVGIDTLSVMAEVVDYDIESFTYTRYRQTDQHDHLTSASTRFASGLTIQLQRWHQKFVARFECSIPRVRYGNNLKVATADETLEVVQGLRSQASDLVKWAEPVDNFSIMRIDITRDFYFDIRAELDGFMEGQRLLNLPYRPPVQLWGDECGYTNLRRGNGKRWRSCLYSKESELKAQADNPRLIPGARAELVALSKCAQGVLRNETMLRRVVLKRTELQTVGDLSDRVIKDLHRKYFRRAGFDHEVGSTDKLRCTLGNLPSTERSTATAMFGMLFIESLGEQPPLSENTRCKYERQAKRLGLTVADMTGLTSSLRLDYDSGALVRRSGMA